MYVLRRDAASAEWFDVAGTGVLLLRRCPSGHWSSPPSMTCPECGSRELRWAPASGDGQIASYAVIHRRGKEPLPVAIVELAEGPWLRGQLQGVDAAGLAIGTPVRVGFATPDGGEPVPYFTPVDSRVAD